MLGPIFGVVGKTKGKVVAVFASSTSEASSAVRHVREGGVTLPIFLFIGEEPSAGLRRECAHVTVHPSSWSLFLAAQRELRRYRIALGIAPWTGTTGDWLLKLSPFTFPPFRVLILNENADFFPPSPRAVWKHISARSRTRLWAEWIEFLRWWIDVKENACDRASLNVLKFAGDLQDNKIKRLRQLSRGLLAYPFAFLAQQYSPLSRFVFQFLGGEETLTLAAEPLQDQSIAVFEYQGREWQRDALEELLNKTKSRWLLFQEAGLKADVNDMLPLFSDARTFAVSRQNAYRGWQDLLFPTAPFQKLQPDEVTRVFAPFSNQILVETAKFRALGIPGLSHCGSNWYLMFWKAAAAGWRSYSAGGHIGIKELPGRPYYEAQFVHALLLDSALARLKPRTPLLARGNISQAKAGGKGFRGLPRVMLLSPYLPFPMSHGGAVRIFSLCQSLADRIDFVLVCFGEQNDVVHYDKLHEVFREVYVVAQDEKHALPHLPEQVAGYQSSSMRALIRELYFQLRIDLLQVEYTQMAAYREAVPDLPAILVEHDITFTLYQQLADREGTPRAEREYRSWLRFETLRLHAFNQVWTMSDYDREQALEAGANPSRTFSIPNGVDLMRFSGDTSPLDCIEEILYVGSFRHRPNYLGFEELRERIMPLIWADFPNIRLRVVAGPDHEKHWEGSHELDSRIVVHGFVEDVAPLYRQCQLVVVPLPVSAGTNVKVMEALAAQRAVVTTPVGCVGLGLEDGKDAVIRELGLDFAAAIWDLAMNPAKRRAIARQGRKTAEVRFAWDSIADRAMAAYARLLNPATLARGLEPDRHESSSRLARRPQRMLR